MQSGDLASRRGELELLSTKQLDWMLQVELQKPEGDPDEVRLILAVLKEREKTAPIQPDDRESPTWKKYLSRMGQTTDKPAKQSARILRAACMVAVLCLLLAAASGTAEAETFWARLVRWSDSVIEFFSPDNSGGGDQEYVFKTDHPGLQQVYDTVVKLGITEPVVPMWLPEGYELISCKEMSTKKKTTLTAYFQSGEKIINYNIGVYSENVMNKYQKNDADVTVIEIEGIDFYIVRNTDAWVAVWVKENIECSISVDCQEDEFYKILRSIYDKEETL